MKSSVQTETSRSDMNEIGRLEAEVVRLRARVEALEKRLVRVQDALVGPDRVE